MASARCVLASCGTFVVMAISGCGGGSSDQQLRHQAYRKCGEQAKQEARDLGHPATRRELAFDRRFVHSLPRTVRRDYEACVSAYVDTGGNPP